MKLSRSRGRRGLRASTLAAVVIATTGCIAGYSDWRSEAERFREPSVGGMAVSLITLFIVPCIYSWVEEARVRRRLSSGAQPASPVETQA